MAENYSLWPELDTVRPSGKRGSSGARAPLELAAEPAGSVGVAPGKDGAKLPLFCAWGGLTPWLRSLDTGKAACTGCLRKTSDVPTSAAATGCPLANRGIEPSLPAEAVPGGVLDLIKVVGCR